MLRAWAWVGLGLLLSQPVVYWLIDNDNYELAQFAMPLGAAVGLTIAIRTEAKRSGPGSPE